MRGMNANGLSTDVPIHVCNKSLATNVAYKDASRSTSNNDGDGLGVLSTDTKTPKQNKEGAMMSEAGYQHKQIDRS
jgi:hypothetical protein